MPLQQVAPLPAPSTLEKDAPCPTDGSVCRILPLGDSITLGFGSTTGAGYRGELFRRAHAAGKQIVFVGSMQGGPATIDGVAFPRAHEGHSGYTIKTGNGRLGIYELTAASLSKYQPHIVMLMVGTNDIDTLADLPRAPERFGALLDLIFASAPDVTVVVARIPPTLVASENTKVVAFNNGISAAVAARAPHHHIRVVDSYAAFTANPRYRSLYYHDPLHPNDAGYALIGDTFWNEALAALLP